MKTLLIALCLTFSLSAFGANLVTNPADTATNTISPTGTDMTGLTANGVSGSQPALKGDNEQDWDALSGSSANGAGLFAYGDSFAGVYATSSRGNSGYFSSDAGTNTQATVLIQAIGGTANLLEVDDVSYNPLMVVDSSGQLSANQGLILSTTGTQPACNSSHRGEMWVVQGGTGVADTLQVCLKAAAGTYSWVTK